MTVIFLIQMLYYPDTIFLVVSVVSAVAGYTRAVRLQLIKEQVSYAHTGASIRYPPPHRKLVSLRNERLCTVRTQSALARKENIA